MAGRILVTGASGTIARALLPGLARTGLPIRAMIHSLDKIETIDDPAIELCVGDFSDDDSLARALEDVETVFLITPPHAEAAQWASQFIGAALMYGRPHIVRLSVIKASPNGPTSNTRLHFRTEHELMGSGLSWTIIRPHFFMQNLFMSVPTIERESAIYWGMGQGHLGMIDVNDIAECALSVLTGDGHESKIYTLTGPSPISFDAVAHELTWALGREITYVPINLQAVTHSIRQMGMGEWFAQVMTDYSRAYRAGWGDFTTGDVLLLTGRRPRSIRNFVTEELVPTITAKHRTAHQ